MADTPSLNSKCSVCGLTAKYITVWYHIRDKSLGCYKEGAKALTDFMPEPEAIVPEIKPVPQIIQEVRQTIQEFVPEPPRIELREPKPIPPTIDEVLAERHAKMAEKEAERALREVDHIIFGSDDEPPSMAELAASSGGFGDFDGGSSILDEEFEFEGEEEPAYLGEDTSPTFLTRDGLVAMPPWVQAIYDTWRTVGYLRSFRDFVLEWVIVAFALCNVDIKMVPVSDDEREEILAALGIYTEQIEAMVG